MYTASVSSVSLAFLAYMFISLTLKILRPSYNADRKSTAIHEPTNTEIGEKKVIKGLVPSFHHLFETIPCFSWHSKMTSLPRTRIGQLS